MGLLDGMFDSEGGRLGLGLLAAGSARSDGAGAGQRLMEAVGSVDAWKKAKEMQRQQLAAHQQAMQMQAMQMQAAQAQMAQQQKIREGMGQFFKLGQQALSPLAGDASTGILPSAGRAAVAPSFDAGGAAQFLAQNGEYDKAFPMLQSLQPKETKLGKGEAVFIGGKKAFDNPDIPDLPTAVREFQFAQNNPAFTPWMLQGKKAGANNTTVSIAGPENKFNQDIGAGLAKDALSIVDVARSAPGTISTAQSIRKALSNGAITGTAADVRLGVQKALETVGLVGEGQAASTQELMAGLSKMTLGGIKTSGLGGGAGFTDKDKIFLESAISGTIADTPENLRRVADLSEKIARANHQKGNQVLGRWQKNPALAGFAQDISIDAIPQEQPASTNKSNLVNDLPKTAPIGSRARDTATGQIMRFDGMKWEAE